ncbi:MAG: c-type cytochrome [Nitrospinota bacterium]|nr:c-type cytochrome [Nitrospinota bacterium]
MPILNKLFIAGIFLLAVEGGYTGADASPELVKNKQCGMCHRFTPDEADKPAPDLFYAGDKFQKDWLENFLQHPEVIRPAGHTRDPGFLRGQPEFSPPHPALKTKEAKEMTDYLISLKILNDGPPLELGDLSKGARVRVKILFERDYSCIACHQSYNLARQPRGGVSGPSFINAGRRLRPEWVYQWLKNPKQFTDRGRMPLYAFDEETLRKLTQYIMSHQKDDSAQ